MKILITTDWYQPVINGVVTSVVNLANGLSAQGHEVRILTLSCDHLSHRIGNVIYMGSAGAGRVYPNARFCPLPTGQCFQELIEWRPDIVHSQCEFSTFLMAKRIAWRCSCPLVHTYHTVYEDFTHYFSHSVSIGKREAAAFSREVLNKTDAVIVPTAKIRDMLHRYGVKVPISVIPSGLELTQFRQKNEDAEALRSSLGIKSGETVLLYLGRLAQEKNIDELLRLLKGQSDPNLRLLLVGDGPYRPQLERKAQELRLGDRVIFAGMVNHAEVARYYGAGDIFVSASHSETQGLTYQEAMAAGLPLLCHEDACLADVIQDGVNGMTYGSDEEFSEKLQRLLVDKICCRTLGAAARETAFSQFSTEKFAENVLNEYRVVLQSKHPERELPA